MTRTRSALAMLVTGLLLMSVSAITVATDEPEPTELTGIDWTLVSITTGGTGAGVPEEVAATLRLDAGQASGSGGCNEFFGDYLVDGAGLSLGPLGATKKLCADPQQQIEDAYFAALGAVAYWQIADDGGLRLLDEQMNEILAFSQVDGGIERTTWLLRHQVVDGTLAAIPEGVLVSLQLVDGDADGTGGCNRYSTSYVIDGASITFGPIAATLMACAGPAAGVEAAYLANLASAATWTSSGSSLAFTDSEGTAILEYEAAPAASVVGSWVAQGINNGVGGVVSSEMTSAITADFAPEGDLSGNDGCNEYRASYELDGDAIAIGPIASTRVACADEDANVQAQEYLAALALVTTWSITDTGNLELRDDAGSLQVKYLQADG